MIDNRTGQRYEIPFENGAVKAIDFRAIKDSPDDFGTMYVYVITSVITTSSLLHVPSHSDDLLHSIARMTSRPLALPLTHSHWHTRTYITNNRVYDPGYFNTAVCKSRITYIDGDKGILEYRGYSIEQLAESSSFLEVSFLLIYGFLPNPVRDSTRLFINFYSVLVYCSLLLGSIGILE